MKARKVMAGDWADLPKDLLIDIAKRFNMVEDLAVFSSVCFTWNDVSSIVKGKLAPAVPWLMMNHRTVNNPSNWTVHNPGTDKCYNMGIFPETRGRFSWGCSDGWILTLNMYMPTEFELFNPLSKSWLPLPSARTFPYIAEFVNCDDDDDFWWFAQYCIISVAVIQTQPDNALRVFVMYDSCSLAFARPGDSVWCTLSCWEESFPDSNEWIFIKSMVGFNGEILILYADGKLESLGNLDSLVPNQSTEPGFFTKEEMSSITDVYVYGDLDSDISLPTHDSETDEESPDKRLHLLELSGDVLVVVVHMNEDNRNIRDLVTLRFEVYKLNFLEKKWEGLKDLGDVALYVSEKSAVMPVCASSNVDNCKPNCIYFMEEKGSGNAMGVFDLSNGVIREICLGNDLLSESYRSFWLMPNLVKADALSKNVV